jgi:hypothetical protein
MRLPVKLEIGKYDLQFFRLPGIESLRIKECPDNLPHFNWEHTSKGKFHTYTST